MARTVTYDISVYPLVLKYLSYHFDTKPFPISSVKNPYASYLSACLDRYDHRETLMPRKFEKLTAQLTLGIPAWQIQNYAAGKLSPKKVAAFNDFVRQMFFEKLTHEVALRTAFGVGIKTATEQFLSRYGISEDELPLNVALRYYDRQRRKLLLDYCPVSRPEPAVILPHERDSADRQIQSGWRQVA